MPANCLAPVTKCAYKKAQQQIKEEAFQNGDFTQKAHQYLSSPDVLENSFSFYKVSITVESSRQDQHGVIRLPVPSTYNWQWESNPRPSDLEAIALFTWRYTPIYSAYKLIYFLL